MTQPAGDFPISESSSSWPRRLIALALLLTAILPTTGCLFDAPLTSEASTNIDTRLLGVFEYREQPPLIENAPPEEQPPLIIHRVAVIPRSPDTYWIFYRNFGQPSAKTLRFIGWISRVDQDYYLSMQDDTVGLSTFGKFAFVKFDWNFPGNFAISSPNMQGLETVATPFEMREGVRSRLAEGTLFPYEATPWDKIARVYWDPKAENFEATLPKEFLEGTTRKQPGL